jgi:sirohydrochlorin cobaltochelatase
MNKLIIILIGLCSIISAQAQDFKDVAKGKTAILMVHFGTTYDDTRAVTIDAINAKVKSEFADVYVAEAYTSRIVIDRLKKRGIDKQTPQEALLRLAADGYTHVVVQSTNVIDGIEAEALRYEASFMVPFFTEIRVGHPLLYSLEDCEKVVTIIANRYKDNVGKNSSVVLIGHGTSTPANAIYSQIDYMFASMGSPKIHLSTVEGYPTYDTTLMRLKEDRAKNITLVPFMFVAGDHARNDIDGEWRKQLEESGYKVKTVFEGLGQISEIQDIYVEHLKAAFAAPILDAVSSKRAFIKENL